MNSFCMYFGRSFFEYLENTFVFQITKAAKAAKADFGEFCFIFVHHKFV